MDVKPTTWEKDWDAFVGYLAKARPQEKKDGPGFVPAVFGDTPNENGSLRTNQNVQAITALVLDLDGKDQCYTTEQLRRAFRGYLYAAHTTYSSTLDNLRWRVVFPLVDPLLPEHLKPAYQSLWDRFGIRGDPQCIHPARLFYLPACPPQCVEDYTLLLGWGQPFVPLYSNYISSSYCTGNTGITLQGLMGGNLPPTPTQQSCHKRALPKGNGKGWMWPETVRKAVENKQALRVGYRNAQWQLTLARALLRCPVDWDQTKLWLVFSRWYDTNSHAIRTPLLLAYQEFVEAFLRCTDQKAGLDIDRLRRVAATYPLPSQTEKMRPKLRLALQACLCLQQWHGQDPFFISAEDMGRVLKAKKAVKDAGKYALTKLQQLGYLQQISQGSKFAGRANTYRIKTHVPPTVDN